MSASVVVVGAGVAGLAAARRLLSGQPSLEVDVLEAAPTVGGRLCAAEVGNLRVDSGADSFVARKPWAVELCRELGMELEEPGARGALVWTERGLVPIPPSALGIPIDLDDLLRHPGLSRTGRARALADLIRRARTEVGDEPLGALLRRRLGDEATERLVAPLLGGLFAGDVDRLGVASTFPELAEWEQGFGSLIRGARAAAKAGGDAGPMFVRPEGGASALPATLATAVGPGRLHISTPATAVARDGDGFLVRTDAVDLRADAVVIAVPAFAAAGLCHGIAPDAAEALSAIPYVSTGVALLVYPEGTAEVVPDVTGFVVPSGMAPMTAATFLSRKWPEQAFGERAVLRCFVGAAGSEDLLDSADEELVEAVCRHLAALLALPERPEAWRLIRWPRSMPQYEVGHLGLVEKIHAALPPGIVVAGNAYRGVGVADAVRSAEDAAARVRAYLAGEPSPSERVG